MPGKKTDKVMNQTKLKAVVHYVIAKSDPSRLGAIRLNKILWYADTIAYRVGGASITGETYIKRQFGPVPRHVLATLGELEHENAIVIRQGGSYSFPMREFVSMSSPDTSTLSAKEVELIEEMRGVICDHYTANSISELTHDQVWEAANIGELIPLSATLAASSGEMTPAVQEWADAAIGRYEQQAA